MHVMILVLLFADALHIRTGWFLMFILLIYFFPWNNAKELIRTRR